MMRLEMWLSGLLGISLACLAYADDHGEAQRLRGLGEIVSLEDILKIARAEQPGRILEVELEHEDEDRWIYELEILDADGLVWKLFFDARDGRFLGKKEHD